jgi:hypothetical protein
VTCDHTIGYCYQTRFDEPPWLVSQSVSKDVEPDDKFNFCPRCGADLRGGANDPESP